MTESTSPKRSASNAAATGSSTTTFTPATGKLSPGNVNIALSLAKASLAQQGVTNPTPTQLAAALNGGTITTAKGVVTLAGVLTQRQAGNGWGQIAHSLGVKLGAVVSASKTDKDGHPAKRTAKGSDGHGSADGSHSQGSSGNAGGHGGGHGGGGGKK